MMKQAEDDPRNITESPNESAIPVEATDVYQHQQQTQRESQQNIQTRQTRPYSNAERQKRYREKRKADKMNACSTISQSSDDQPQREQPQDGDHTNKRRSQSNAERQRKYRKLLREKRQQKHSSSVQQEKKVDEAELARKRHLNKQRQSRFRARQRFQWLSTSSHQAQAERKSELSTMPVPTSSETDCNESSNSEPVVVKPIIHNSWLALNIPSKALDLVKKEPNDDSSISTLDSTSDENSSFFQFFRGIHSDYLELPARKQRLFKRKCLNYLHELLDEEENDKTMPEYTHPVNVLNLSNAGLDDSDDDEDVKPLVVDGCILPNI
ncbi:uncharacterized protein LOC125070065 [Vanessa atalanta]|uniref:uncharacterized protein LOC125070065 n=1 Tax=Vanessa atalanta TaxID=42275 RepID=UPI001FCD07B4|nr:uncharacterized protein LOC125070065 [Vanessa atalanta]